MLKVKVCGMRDIANIEALVKLPIQYMGFIFYEKSSRHIDEATTKQLEAAFSFLEFKNLYRHIEKVGVFVNAEEDYILEKVERLQLDYVQLHGRESVFFCEKLAKRDIKIIKAFSVDERFRFTNTDFYQFFCEYFLFDTKGKLPGGNGESFNWKLLENYTGNTPFFLSGGIKKEDASIIKQLDFECLHAIDINSKFETAPALKDIPSIKQFLSDLKESKKTNKSTLKN